MTFRLAPSGGSGRRVCRRLCPAFALALGLTLAWPASAGDAAFHRFAGSEDHLARAAAVALEADAGLVPSCPQRSIADRTAVEVELPVRFDAGPAQPSEGTWWERWRIEGCGPARDVNLHFTADASGISVDIGLPGETLADAPSQQDAVSALGPFARQVLDACESFTVVDTRVAVPPPQGDGGETWTERWTLAGCGREAAVTIRFLAGQSPSLFEIVAG